MIKTYLFLPKEGLKQELGIEDVVSKLETTGACAWIDVESMDDKDADILEQKFGVHRLAIEDCRTEETRPKIDTFKEHLFIVLDAIISFPKEEDIETVNLSAFLSERYIITVHNKYIKSVSDIQKNLEKIQSSLAQGPDNMLHAQIDAVIDNYFPILNNLDKMVEEAEDRVFSEFSNKVQEEIFDSKKKIFQLRRYVTPQMSMLYKLANKEIPYIKQETRVYFSDVYDHLLRITDSLATYRDLLTGVMDSYMSRVTNKTNEIMKTLSVVATIMLPLALISGIYGMNFIILPGSKEPYGFWGVIGLMFLLAVTMLAFFKKKKWF